MNSKHGTRCRKRKTTSSRKAIEERIRRLEEAIGKARAYLERGEEAHWSGFRPLFARKMGQNGEASLPHKDWVRNVFLPGCERSLRDAEKILDRIENR